MSAEPDSQPTLAPDAAWTIHGRWRERILRTYGPALVGYALLAVFAMWPAVSDISNTIMGPHQPSDATAGGVWNAWQFAHTALGDPKTNLLGYPVGGRLWTPPFFTALAWVIPLWLLAHIATPVAAWNLVVLLGILVDAMVMFGLCVWLTGRRLESFVAGILFAFSPFAIVQSHIHVGYVYDWIYPLILWSALAWIVRPNRKSAIILGAAMGLSAYVDGYYVVFAPLVGAVAVILAILLAPLANRKRRALAGTIPVVAGASIVAAFPVALLYKLQSGTVNGILGADRSRNAVEANSAQLAQYLVPFRTSPQWHSIVTGIFGSNVRLPNVTGPCLYVGLTSLVVVITLIITIWQPRFEEAGVFRLSARFLATFAATGAFLVMLASFATIGPVPGPPKILWAIEPFWRAFARLGEGVVALIVLAVVLGLVLIARSRRRWLAPVVAVTLIVDATYILPWKSWSYSANTPSAIQWLAVHPDGGVVAAYPMVQGPLPPFEYYLSYQPVDGHGMFDGAPPGTAHARLERGLSGLLDPQTVGTLSAEGVRYVLVNPSLYTGVTHWAHAIPGLTAIVRGPVWLFRVHAPKAVGALAVGSGFNLERQFLPNLNRWMTGRNATLDVDRFDASQRLRIGFRATSYRIPRTLTVSQSGKHVWTGIASPRGTAVTFSTASTAPLRLTVYPGSVKLPGWVTTRSVDVTNLGAQAASTRARHAP